MFTKSKLSWRMGLRPNSSLQGAQSSQPKAYNTRKIMAPHRAPWALTLNSFDMPSIPLEYRLVLKFIETCTRKMMVRILHFLDVGNEYPSWSEQSSSVISILSPLPAFSKYFSGPCGWEPLVTFSVPSTPGAASGLVPEEPRMLLVLGIGEAMLVMVE